MVRLYMMLQARTVCCLSSQVYVGFPGPDTVCPESLRCDRGRECVSVTPPLGISVLPEVSTQLIHVSTSGYLWIYTGAEHWINRAVLLVVVVVVIYDGKPPLRGRWVNVLFLIFHSQIYCMSADTEAGDGI